MNSAMKHFGSILQPPPTASNRLQLFAVWPHIETGTLTVVRTTMSQMPISPRQHRSGTQQTDAHHSSQPQLLSFDIGTRHLAYCAYSLPPQDVAPTSACTTDHMTDGTGNPTPSIPLQPPVITHWRVVDLLSVPGTPHDESCVYVLAKGWRASQMRSYLDQHHLPSSGSRAVLLERIVSNLKQRKVPKVASSNLNVIALKMYAFLDTQPWMLSCRTVVLENQPCLTNPIMKSVQMLLYGYFLYRSVWCTHVHREVQQHATPPTPANLPLARIMLTSATNKLKTCEAELQQSSTEVSENVCVIGDSTSSDSTTETGPVLEPKSKPKAAYKARKKEAIALATNILHQWHEQSRSPDSKRQVRQWQHLLSSSCMKEQDDLSDSMLQGLFVLRRDGIDGNGLRATTTKNTPKKAKNAKNAKTERQPKKPTAET
jgi:hypothetical protein